METFPLTFQDATSVPALYLRGPCMVSKKTVYAHGCMVSYKFNSFEKPQMKNKLRQNAFLNIRLATKFATNAQLKTHFIIFAKQDIIILFKLILTCSRTIFAYYSGFSCTGSNGDQKSSSSADSSCPTSILH